MHCAGCYRALWKRCCSILTEPWLTAFRTWRCLWTPPWHILAPNPWVRRRSVTGWGRGAWQLIRQACDGVITDPDLVEQAYSHFLQHYAEQCAHNPCLYPGVAQGLAEIQAQVPTALVTNKPLSFTQTMLDSLGLTFSVVLGGDSVAIKKPDPSMLLTACSAMQVDPAGCVMIGDSSNDSEARARRRHAGRVIFRWLQSRQCGRTSGPRSYLSPV